MDRKLIFNRSINHTIEKRCLLSHELRASDPGQPQQLIGYGALFNTPTQLPGFKEQVRAGAFQRSLRNDDIKFLWNHDTNIVLGSSKAGTLRLAEDSRGLKFVCDLPATRSAAEYHESVRRGDVSGVSWGFQVGKEGQVWSEERAADGSYFALRTLTDFARVTDVSPTPFPAYQGTEIQARSLKVDGLDVVPVELRSRVDQLNRVRPPAKKYFVMPTAEECMAITERAMDRRANEKAVIQRRKNILNEILS